MTSSGILYPMGDVRDDLHRRHLDAEMNEEYYRKRAASASWMDRFIQILAAISSLSAVAVWISSQGPRSQKAWALLLIVSAILSATSPILRWFDDAVKFTDLASKWTVVAGKLRVLRVREIDDAKLRECIVEICIEMEALQREDTSEPRNALIAKMRQKITERHGLQAA